jgi:dTDP-4-dehydrorhamnose 3,5-epimerase-like enzyme
MIKNIKINKISNKSGELIFLESKKIFKNGFKRFFSVSVNKKVVRGEHSHYKCTQILFSLNGSMVVFAYEKKKKKWTQFKLKKNFNYLIVPPNNYLKIKYTNSNSILGVLCDRYYDPKDYNYKKD